MEAAGVLELIVVVGQAVGDLSLERRYPSKLLPHHSRDGSVDVEVSCGNRMAFRSWLYAMVDRAEVVSPEFVRNEIVADLARLAGGAS